MALCDILLGSVTKIVPTEPSNARLFTFTLYSDALLYALLWTGIVLLGLHWKLQEGGSSLCLTFCE